MIPCKLIPKFSLINRTSIYFYISKSSVHIPVIRYELVSDHLFYSKKWINSGIIEPCLVEII